MTLGMGASRRDGAPLSAWADRPVSASLLRLARLNHQLSASAPQGSMLSAMLAAAKIGSEMLDPHAPLRVSVPSLQGPCSQPSSSPLQKPTSQPAAMTHSSHRQGFLGPSAHQHPSEQQPHSSSTPVSHSRPQTAQPSAPSMSGISATPAHLADLLPWNAPGALRPRTAAGVLAAVAAGRCAWVPAKPGRPQKKEKDKERPSSAPAASGGAKDKKKKKAKKGPAGPVRPVELSPTSEWCMRLKVASGLSAMGIESC